MLTYEQRTERYLAQTGRVEPRPGVVSERLTPRQRRRADHKAGHQGATAVGRRTVRSAARAKARAAKRNRSASLPTAATR